MQETNSNEWSKEDYIKYRNDQKALEMKNSKNKFGNKWIKVDGINFQSIHESEVYLEYKRQKQSGIIKDFKRQVRYKFIINGVQVSSYRADFVLEYHDGAELVVDAKSDFTRKLNDYVIRKKLMKACFGIDIHERR